MTGARWGADCVSVRYGRRLALADVSFPLAEGQVAAVVGGDGAGKTTLLRCLAGALEPASGRIRRPGARGIGYLAPGSGTYPDLSVAENLDFRASAYGIGSGLARQRAARYLERTGLAAARDRLAGRLSGGMRQKLGVIAAMLHQPELLILDEPTTGIDPVSRADLWWLIAAAAADGAAVAVATAYLDDAERSASVLVLDRGEMLATGTPAEIVASIPGAIRSAPAAPDGEERRHAWRRGAAWRVWDEPGTSGAAQAGRSGAVLVQPDLQDAVTVAALAREIGTPDLAASLPARGLAASRTAETRDRGGGAMTDVLAECRAVVRRFGSHAAVDAVDLRVNSGEVVGLLGANGAGKTTLIRILLGLLRPSAGQVLLFGEHPSRRVRGRIGYVPQGLGLYDDLTPAENMAFARAAFGVGATELPAELRPFGDTVVTELPLGVQRRVAFAQALAHLPGLLALDEPTSGVDPLARARLWQTIREAADAGAGVLVTTHYMDEAAECDRLVVMARGRVVASGTPAEITGTSMVTVVHGPSWADAYAAIEAGGLSAALAGPPGARGTATGGFGGAAGRWAHVHRHRGSRHAGRTVLRAHRPAAAQRRGPSGRRPARK